MVKQNGNTYISWKWLVGILVTLFLAASGLIVNDTRIGISDAKTKIECLQKEKVDKDQYKADIKEIKENLTFLVKREMGK